MDYRERANPQEEALAVALDGAQSRIWTALPGLIQSFDVDALTCEVQAALQVPRLKPDGETELLTMPLMTDCPVVFPSGGGCTLTFPLAAGDECLIVIASRCIDSWWQNGGVQPPATFRMHDLSDGFVIPGPHSKARPLSGVSETAAQFRTDTGESYVEIDPDGGGVIKIKSPNPVTIDAPELIVTGDLTVNGDAFIGGAATVAEVLTVLGNAYVATVLEVGEVTATPLLIVGSVVIGESGGFPYGEGYLEVGHLTVTKDTSLTGPTTVKGNLGLTGDLDVTGTVDATGDITSLTDLKVSTILSFVLHEHVGLGEPHDSFKIFTGVSHYP